jgi:hypothetical protein
MRAPCSEASLGTMQPSRRTLSVGDTVAGSQPVVDVGSKWNGTRWAAVAAGGGGAEIMASFGRLAGLHQIVVSISPECMTSAPG